MRSRLTSRWIARRPGMGGGFRLVELIAMMVVAAIRVPAIISTG